MHEMKREAWMTEALEGELQAIATDGSITCEQAQAFAEKHSIEITKMKSFVDRIGLQVTGCRGLCA